MSNKAIAAIVAAALVVGGGVAVVASSVGGDDSRAEEVHQLPGGGTHTGPMPSESHDMGGEMMDGSSMGGSE